MIQKLVSLTVVAACFHLGAAGAIEIARPVDKACLEKNAKEYVSCFTASGGDPTREAACSKAKANADKACPRK